jgi:hypothetical protein
MTKTEMQNVCALTFNDLNTELMDMELNEVEQLLRYAKVNDVADFKLKRIHQRYSRLKSQAERNELF